MKKLLMRRILLGLAVPAAMAALRAAAGRLQSRPGYSTSARRLERVADGIEGLFRGRRSTGRTGAWGDGRRGRARAPYSSPSRW